MTTQERIIHDITGFIFIKDEPRPADIIFIPGSSWPELSELAARFYREGLAPYVVPSGKYSYRCDCFTGPRFKCDVYHGNYASEWEFERAVLIQNGVPEEAILREDQSTHTVDNAFFTKKAVDMAGLTVRSAILCCKAYHARRCLMTYGWAFPGVDFIVCPVATQGIGYEDWHLTEDGRDKVLSEVSKCGSFFKEVRELFPL